MYLQIGNFRHDSGECSVSIARQSILQNNMVVGFTERWEIQGRLHANTPAEVSAAIALRQLAYRAVSPDVALYFDDGTLSSHFMRSIDAQGGLRIVRPIDFPEGRGAEYTTFRNFSAAIEGDFLDPAVTLTAWTENLTFRGGGPEFGFLLTLNGPPQKQQLREATTYKATQQGEAVGMYSYPLPAAPLWPAAEHLEQRDISFDLPQRVGRAATLFYKEYKIRWSYSFESDVPLIGFPTPWPD